MYIYIYLYSQALVVETKGQQSPAPPERARGSLLKLRELLGRRGFQCEPAGAQGLGFRVWGLGFRAWGSGFRV